MAGPWYYDLSLLSVFSVADTLHAHTADAPTLTLRPPSVRRTPIEQPPSGSRDGARGEASSSLGIKGSTSSRQSVSGVLQK
jgi:hypothetical protein